MRFTLVIFAVLFTMCSTAQVRVAYAQPNSKIPCDEDCIEQRLPYIFCDKTTGDKYTKCSDNPNNEPHLKPLKKRLPPSCRTYDASGLTAVQAGYSLVEWRDGVAHTLFDPVNVEADALVAAYSWYFESGCPEQTDGQDCCLNVRWADERQKFKGFENNPEDALAVMHQKGAPSAGGVTCDIDCNESALILNSTPEFMNKNNRGIPTRFFYNVEPPTDNGDDYEYFHLPSVLLHEVGHWYGLGHMGEPDHFGETCGETRGNYRLWERDCMQGKSEALRGIQTICAPSVNSIVVPKQQPTLPKTKKFSTGRLPSIQTLCTPNSFPFPQTELYCFIPRKYSLLMHRE